MSAPFAARLVLVLFNNVANILVVIIELWQDIQILKLPTLLREGSQYKNVPNIGKSPKCG